MHTKLAILEWLDIVEWSVLNHISTGGYWLLRYK
jgi:hypothetical protein